MRQLSAFPGPNVDEQVTHLRERLLKPAPRVETLPYNDFSGVDPRELVRRGVYRISPADNKGEELRDVAVWMMVLHYAKKSGSEVGFITKDKGFTAAEEAKLHPQLASDIAEAGVRVSFYTDVGAFIVHNSLQTEGATEGWLYTVVQKRSIEEAAIENVRKAFSRSLSRIQNVAIDDLRLSAGETYKVADESLYAELLFSGSSRLTVKQPTFAAPDQATDARPGFSTLGWPMTNPASTRPHLNALSVNYSSRINALYFPLQTDEVFQQFMYPVILDDPLFDANQAETVHRCEFELKISARIEGNKLIALQTDGFEVKKVEKVPNLAAGVR